MRAVQLLGSALRSFIAMAMGAMLLFAGPGRVAAATTLTVCPSGCAYSQVGPALAAANDGDTIKIGAGTYTGGLTINASVKLIGAGAGKTVIKGGGPVVTIGTYAARSQPTVSLRGLTITGGVSHSSLLSSDWFGTEGVAATGGGVEILPKADANGNFVGGAKVTITDSVITGNRVAPTTTIPAGFPCPNGHDCTFAWAKGGGIDTFGPLTLVNTTVSNNTAAGVASDADGGGISVWRTGQLTLAGSRVTGNRAIAVAPNGRYAEGGGIFTDGGIVLKISDSLISDNVARLTSTLPYLVPGADPLDMSANGGGIHVGDASTEVITGTTIRNNLVRVDDPNGQPYAFDSAVTNPSGGSLVLRDSTITKNWVVAHVGSSADVGPSGTALDINGPATVSHVRITDNTATVTSTAGDAAVAAAGVYAGNTGSKPIVISDTIISGNTSTASSTHGSASVVGAGLLNDGGLLVIRDSLLTANVGIAKGHSGTAQGGGIWNGSLYNESAPQLTLSGTSVSRNSIVGSSGVTLQGGGLFTTVPVTIHGGHITHNRPDDCSGC